MNPNPARHLDSLYQVFQCCKTSQYFHLAITPLWYWMRSVLWCPWICPISWHLTRGSYSDQLSTACIRFNNVAQNQATLQNETTSSLNKDIRFFALLMSFVSILNGCRSLVLYWQTHQICNLFGVFPFLATRTLCRFPQLGLICVDAGCLRPDSKSVDGWHLILSTQAEQAVYTQMIQPCLRQIPILLHFCCSWLSSHFTLAPFQWFCSNPSSWFWSLNHT